MRALPPAPAATIASVGAAVLGEESELRVLVMRKTPFLEVLKYLKEREGGKLGGFQFLRIFQEEVGISFVKTRELLGCFDPEMNPIVEPEVINERWNAILESWNAGS